MLNIAKILIDGGILSFAFLVLVVMLGINKPRLFLNKEDVPADILAAVPPKTEVERSKPSSP